jgi:hypothetical protein
MTKNSIKEAHSFIVIFLKTQIHCIFQDDVPKEVYLDSQGNWSQFPFSLGNLAWVTFFPKTSWVGKWGQVVQGKHPNGHFLPWMSSSNLPKNTSKEEDDCQKKIWIQSLQFKRLSHNH